MVRLQAVRQLSFFARSYLRTEFLPTLFESSPAFSPHRLTLARLLSLDESRSASPDHPFVLQGDNNSWIDSYKPTQPELIGKCKLKLSSQHN